MIINVMKLIVYYKGIIINQFVLSVASNYVCQFLFDTVPTNPINVFKIEIIFFYLVDSCLIQIISEIA